MTKEECREQIQEDIMTFMDGHQYGNTAVSNFVLDNLCQIVVDNFKKLED